MSWEKRLLLENKLTHTDEYQRLALSQLIGLSLSQTLPEIGVKKLLEITRVWNRGMSFSNQFYDNWSLTIIQFTCICHRVFNQLNVTNVQAFFFSLKKIKRKYNSYENKNCSRKREFEKVIVYYYTSVSKRNEFCRRDSDRFFK